MSTQVPTDGAYVPQPAQSEKADPNQKTSENGEGSTSKAKKGGSETKENPTAQTVKDAVSKTDSKAKDGEFYQPSSSATDISEINIEQLLARVSPQISDLVKEIEAFNLEKELIRKAIHDKKHLLKPIKLVDKRLNIRPKRLSREKRKALKVEIKHLESRLLWLNEKIEAKNATLSHLSMDEAEKLDEQRLKDKSNSEAYIKRNEYSIKQRLLNTLNSILQKGDDVLKSSFYDVRRLSFSTTEEGGKIFREALAELLKNSDRRTFLLTSGKLKEKLYEAVRLTLTMWNSNENTISRLVFSEDLKEDVKTAHDPFEKNRTLISTLILRFFNQAISDEKKREKIIALRDLGRDVKLVKTFTNKMEDFVDQEDVDVYQLGAGGLRNRLNETLRLTLLKWQPELKGGFEEVEIAAPVAPQEKRAKSSKTTKSKTSPKKKATKTKK